MIISRLTGGLGNQMFQYAAGLTLSTRLLTILKLDAAGYGPVAGRGKHEIYSLSCFNIVEQFASAGEVETLLPCGPGRWQRALRRLRGQQPVVSRRYTQQAFTFATAFLSLPDEIYLDGTWQCEKYFEPVAPVLRRHFTFKYPLPASAAEIARRIQQDPFAVAVHFRRGDYLSSRVTTHARALQMDYYHHALEVMRERMGNSGGDPSLYIFSDDIGQVADEFHTDLPCIFVKAKADWQAYDELRLMAKCRHHIIANSTFSWWAAWLNDNPGKTVIAPDPWFANDRYDGSQVIPQSWIRLPAEHAAGEPARQELMTVGA